jgi:hypothetical protein
LALFKQLALQNTRPLSNFLTRIMSCLNTDSLFIGF